MKVKWTLAVACLAGGGCITVNIHFPAREVEEAARVIVEEARPEAEPPPPPSSLPATSGRRPPLPLLASFGAAPQEGQSKKEEKTEEKLQIDIQSPVIKEIRESLKKRFPKLLPLYERGAVGETRKGYLEVREDGLGIKEKRDRKALLEEENRDRRNLYEEILKANKIGKEHLKDVEVRFGREWIEKSRTGWWVQDEEGKWIKKPPPPKDGKKEGGKKEAAA